MVKLFNPALFALLAAVSTLLAADNGSWQVLAKSLKTGATIRVVEQNMTSHVGKLASIDDDNIRVTERSGQERTISRNKVVRVSNDGQRKRHALWGVLIGVVAGAAVGFGSVYGAGGATTSETARGVSNGVWIGGGMGAGIGAALPADRTLYRMTPATGDDARSRSPK